MTTRDTDHNLRAAAAAHGHIRNALLHLTDLERTVAGDLDRQRMVDRVRGQLLVASALLLPATKAAAAEQARLPFEMTNG